MRHVPQTELVRLVAAELPDARRAEVERHLAECADCRARFEQQAATWQLLGECSPPIRRSDVLAGVEQRLARPIPLRRPLWDGAKGASRVAAAILIGVGAGYGAARTWSPAPRPSTSPAVEQAALAALGIDYFQTLAPAGLYTTIQDVPAEPDREEGQS